METLTHLDPATKDAVADLIHANVNEAHALEEALRQSDSLGLGVHLRSLAKERRALAHQLQSLLGMSGEQPPRTSSLRSEVELLWQGFKSAILGGDPERIVKQVIAGEDRLEHAYHDALRAAPASPLNATLMDHVRRIRDDKETLRVLMSSLQSPIA
tara:strand:+ start:181 stop:651 length:471 start_codon:yes stop_codon:yes gene_type:complete